MFYMRLHTQRYQSMTTHCKLSKAILFAIFIKKLSNSLGVHTCRILKKIQLKKTFYNKIIFNLKNSPCTLREPIIKYGQNNNTDFKNPY